MSSTVALSTIAFALLCLSAPVQVVAIFRRRRDAVSPWILLAAALLLFATIGVRSVAIRFVAVTNTYESLVFFSGVIALILFFYGLKGRERSFGLIALGVTVTAIALLAVASSPIAPKEVEPPIPALQSSWLVLHVTFAFIGEAFFAVSFVAALLYLGTKDEERQKGLDRVIYTAIGIGYPIFTAGGLVFGAIWAQRAWGAYWSWDPKETWALVTWLTYTAYLHTRLIRKMRGRTSAILAVVGFAFTLFTFFGVNFLLSGLHSYA